MTGKLNSCSCKPHVSLNWRSTHIFMVLICISSTFFHTASPKDTSEEQKIFPFLSCSPHLRKKFQLVHLLNHQLQIFPGECVCHIVSTNRNSTCSVCSIVQHMEHSLGYSSLNRKLVCFPMLPHNVRFSIQIGYLCLRAVPLARCWATPSSHQVTCHSPSGSAALAHPTRGHPIELPLSHKCINQDTTRWGSDWNYFNQKSHVHYVSSLDMFLNAF